MSDLYSINTATKTLTTSTCRFVDHTLHNNSDTTYEEVILDLCRCLAVAIESDDAQGKMVLGLALHTVLSSVLTEE